MEIERGVKLETINRILGWFGLVLVVRVSFKGTAPTVFWIERRSRYRAACRESEHRQLLERMALADAIASGAKHGE